MDDQEFLEAIKAIVQEETTPLQDKVDELQQQLNDSSTPMVK
jgi:uncharacterized protein (DUF2461 family)